ncbi:hypothetical protein BTM_6137 (plasmid) [Burkholderia thailandensis 34]|nr:hypothetical protein BTM_6137 [Burkholderia thailandensis 34]
MFEVISGERVTKSHRETTPVVAFKRQPPFKTFSFLRPLSGKRFKDDRLSFMG